MQIHRDLNNLPNFKNAVITIGTFDGVHTGHLQIIKQLKQEAGIINGEAVIITFDPHPRMVINLDKAEIKLLNTLEEKIELLAKQSIDHLVIAPFTKKLSELSAETFIKEFLVETFHPHTIIIGYDHHFGKDRKGNYKLLKAYSEEFRYVVKEIPEQVLNEVTISSTKIRKAILNSDIETANHFLGYDYFFEGMVVEGNKIGRTIGYPTANIEINDINKLTPGDGIYAVNALVNKEMKMLKGMMSIGLRPTIGISNRTIEVNIFDFNKDIYGEKIRVYVKKFIREEKKFKDLQELKIALDQDKLDSIKLLSEI